MIFCSDVLINDVLLFTDSDNPAISLRFIAGLMQSVARAATISLLQLKATNRVPAFPTKSKITCLARHRGK